MLSVYKTTVFFFKSTSKHEKQLRGTGTGRQFVLTTRTKTIERTGTGRQFPPFLASLSATKFSLQIYMELTVLESSIVYYHIMYNKQIDFILPCVCTVIDRGWRHSVKRTKK